MPVPVKVKEKVEVKVPMPFPVKEPYPIRVPFPVPVAVPMDAKDERKKAELPAVIRLPPNIIHNFMPPPQHKLIAINRKPIVQHFYPKPAPEPKPAQEIVQQPDSEPEPEPEADREIDEETDMALLQKWQVKQGQRSPASSEDLLMPAPGFAARSPIMMLDPVTCLIRGLAPGSAFVPGMGYLNPLQANGYGRASPFQGMSPPSLPPVAVNAMATSHFGIPRFDGLPAAAASNFLLTRAMPHPSWQAESVRGSIMDKNCRHICSEKQE